MFQGKAKSFSKVSEFQDKWHVDPRETGARKGTEYRAALRDQAKLAYRLAKKTVKDMEKSKN
jgi:hypothetical protein|tara:strand:+ start:384 stop:569 length:186 start_codon:yes stop_codon:yes gene_type:complete